MDLVAKKRSGVTATAPTTKATITTTTTTITTTDLYDLCRQRNACRGQASEVVRDDSSVSLLLLLLQLLQLFWRWKTRQGKTNAKLTRKSEMSREKEGEREEETGRVRRTFYTRQHPLSRL